MDLADDIAYSTYDLEDAFKAGFLSPLSMASADNSLKQRIADVVNKKMRTSYPKALSDHEALTIDGVDRIILAMTRDIFQPSQELFERMQSSNMSDEELSYALSAEVSAGSRTLQEEGRYRNEFTSRLVYALHVGYRIQLERRNALSQFYWLEPWYVSIDRGSQKIRL